MDPIRVVLVDDHPVVLGGLRALLASLPGYEVVGEATDGEAGVREVVLTKPDVVLMDIRMPGIDGLEATRRIREAVRGVAVLVLTMFDDDDTVFGAMRAGAQGYLLKGADQDEIDRAIRAVVAGEAIFSPGVAAAGARLLRRAAAGRGPVPRADRTRARGARPGRRRACATSRSPSGCSSPPRPSPTTSRRSS